MNQTTERRPDTLQEVFRRAARRTSQFVGSSLAFFTACLVVVIWAITGAVFGFSDTWQLVINTATTIVTFLVPNQASSLR
jgi:low affinity Fe/Cu permease